MCRWPYEVMAGTFVPCGRCLHCRINKERIWVHRLMLELRGHEKASFVTLTYDDEHLPEGANLVPMHLTNTMKRIRRHVSPRLIRFYAVGEYGDLGRPHFHIALFGIGGSDALERLHKGDSGKVKLLKYIPAIDKSWDYGNIDIGELNRHSARYLVGYIGKGIVRSRKEWLKGRHPEFSRMSNRPGIGALSAKQIGEEIARSGFYSGGTVKELRVGKHMYPLGSYISHQVSEQLGMDEFTRAGEFLEWQKEIYSEALGAQKGVRKYILETDESKRHAQKRRREFYKQRRIL